MSKPFKHPLQHLYDQVPEMDCKGHCGKGHDHCCGPIGASVAEATIMEQYSGISAPWETLGNGSVKMDSHAMFPDVRCPYLEINGRCSVYEVRPMVCRLWGAIHQLKCPWGCKPKGGYLTPVQGRRLLGDSLLYPKMTEDRDKAF